MLLLRERVDRALEVALPLEGERDGDGVREGERYRGMLGCGIEKKLESEVGLKVRGSSGTIKERCAGPPSGMRYSMSQPYEIVGSS